MTLSRNSFCTCRDIVFPRVHATRALVVVVVVDGQHAHGEEGVGGVVGGVLRIPLATSALDSQSSLPTSQKTRKASEE